MSGKDQSVTSKNALLSTKPGKQILKQGLIKSKGYKLFKQYKEEAENDFPNFAQRFTNDLLSQIKSDNDPKSTQQEFAKEVGDSVFMLEDSEIPIIKSKLEDVNILKDRVLRILDSNFVKMTFPIFNALFDAASNDSTDKSLRQDMVDGHIIAIDLSEPMDRIVDKDEDLDYLDDYKLLNPYILKIAREKIARGGQTVLESFEDGFVDARLGQNIDVELKSKKWLTLEDMNLSYKKYRAVMGTAGRNMALDNISLGEIFYLGMARAAECVGCGNEIEDSIKNGYVKIPSWPLYYTRCSNSVKQGFQSTINHSMTYLDEARLALELLPDDFTHTPFLDFLFLTVEHYNRYWYNKLQESNMWDTFDAKLAGV